MERTASWSMVGTDIVNLNNKVRLHEALEKANLDYTVTKENIFTPSGLIVPGKQATIKTYKDGTSEVSGVVSSKYEVCQNWDAFNFVDNLVDEGVEIVKAGETYTGMVYLIGKLPEVNILGDTFQPNIIFQNSHNGNVFLGAAICMLRIVCQNQFANVFKNSDNSIRVLHTKSMEQRMKLAHSILSNSFMYAKQFGDNANALAMMKIDTATINKAFDSFLGYSADREYTKQQLNVFEDAKVTFLNAYQQGDNANFTGTAWGAINAFADYETHKTLRKTEHASESRFMNLTQSKEAAKFLNIIRNVA